LKHLTTIHFIKINLKKRAAMLSSFRASVMRLRVADLGRMAVSNENKKSPAGSGGKKRGDGEGPLFRKIDSR
jgi:hypothetical protein